jgi:hypothetical protein
MRYLNAIADKALAERVEEIWIGRAGRGRGVDRYLWRRVLLKTQRAVIASIHLRDRLWAVPS